MQGLSLGHQSGIADDRSHNSDKNKTMKTLAQSLLILLTISTVSMANPGGTARKGHSTAPAATYQMAAYPSADATTLFVTIDKQAGGRLNIQLKDKSGTLFFEEVLNRREAKVRLKLNIADLKDGVYQLTVSNGVDTTVRDITIATNEPSQAVRNIVLL